MTILLQNLYLFVAVLFFIGLTLFFKRKKEGIIDGELRVGLFSTCVGLIFLLLINGPLDPPFARFEYAGLIYILVAYGGLALGIYLTLKGIFKILLRKKQTALEGVESKTTIPSQPWKIHRKILLSAFTLAIFSSVYIYIKAEPCTEGVFLCGLGEAIAVFLYGSSFLFFPYATLSLQEKFRRETLRAQQ